MRLISLFNGPIPYPPRPVHREPAAAMSQADAALNAHVAALVAFCAVKHTPFSDHFYWRKAD